MQEPQTYEQARTHIVTELDARELGDMDRLHANPVAREVRDLWINFVSVGAKTTGPLDRQGKRLYNQLQEAIQEFDTYEQTKRRDETIEDLF